MRKLSVLTLGVSNLERSIRFYEMVLGLKGKGFSGITFAQNAGSSAKVTELLQRAVNAGERSSSLDNPHSGVVSQAISQTPMVIFGKSLAIQNRIPKK